MRFGKTVLLKETGELQGWNPLAALLPQHGMQWQFIGRAVLNLVTQMHRREFVLARLQLLLLQRTLETELQCHQLCKTGVGGSGKMPGLALLMTLLLSALVCWSLLWETVC